MAFRVPVPDVSVVDLTVRLKKEVQYVYSGTSDSYSLDNLRLNSSVRKKFDKSLVQLESGFRVYSFSKTIFTG